MHIFGRQALIVALLTLLCRAPSFGATAPPLQINAQGTFVDRAFWNYRRPEGGFRNGVVFTGTNETIFMPAPQPFGGESVIGITHVHHREKTPAYPLHISLVEKIFAIANKVVIYGEYNEAVYKYINGDPFEKEEAVSTNLTGSYRASRPMPAAGSIPTPLKTPFAAANAILQHLSNLPVGQKNLKNYVVMFVDSTDTTWVEFAPLLNPGESAHLGCQFQLGRDMVFGIPKNLSTTGGQAPVSFIQCF